MKKLDGMLEAFKTSKQVFLKTMTSEAQRGFIEGS